MDKPKVMPSPTKMKSLHRKYRNKPFFSFFASAKLGGIAVTFFPLFAYCLLPDFHNYLLFNLEYQLSISEFLRPGTPAGVDTRHLDGFGAHNFGCGYVISMEDV